MALSARALDRLHQTTVKCLIGLGVVGVGLSIVAIKDIMTLRKENQSKYQAELAAGHAIRGEDKTY